MCDILNGCFFYIFTHCFLHKINLYITVYLDDNEYFSAKNVQIPVFIILKWAGGSRFVHAMYKLIRNC